MTDCAHQAGKSSVKTAPLGLEPIQQIFPTSIWLFLASSFSCKWKSLACQITSPFNKKIGCFERQFLKFDLILQTTQLIVQWGSYLEL